MPLATFEDVSTTHSDGEFTSGEEFELLLRTSRVVYVTGVPLLAIDLDDGPKSARYESGSGSDTLVFRLIAEDGDTTTSLRYVSNASLTLNGGTIQDSDGDNATLTLPDPGDPGSLDDNSAISLVEYTDSTTIHDVTQSRMVTAFQEASVAIAAKVPHSVWVDRVLTGDRDGYIGELHRGRLPAVELIQERDAWSQKSLDNGLVTSTWRIRVHIGHSDQVEAEANARAILYAGLIKVRQSNYFKIGDDNVSEFQGSPLGHMLETVITVEHVMRRSTYETQNTGTTTVPQSEGGMGGISLEIGYNDTSPVAILVVDADQAVDEVSLQVLEEFDDAASTVTIGIDGEQGRYLAGNESDVTELDSIWQKDANDTGPKTIKVWIHPGASTQGRIAVQISLTDA